MHLPEIDVIRLETLERKAQLGFGFQAGALGRLGGEEDVLANPGKPDAVGFFGLAIPIAVGAIKEVEAEIIHAADMIRRGANRRMEVHAGAALGDNRDLDPGLAELSHGDAASLGFCCSGGSPRERCD